MTADSTGNGSDKAALRRDALARRSALTQDEREQASTRIARSCIELLERHRQPGDVLAGYWPIRGEIDPRPVLDAHHRSGLPCALPAIVADDMVFRSWTPHDQLVPGGFGTLAPGEEAPIVTPHVVLVPLLAFDRGLHRLGYGRAFYDRALASLRAGGPVLTIGIAHSVQEIAAVPSEPHDQRLDMIVTEREILYPPSA